MPYSRPPKRDDGQKLGSPLAVIQNDMDYRIETSVGCRVAVMAETGAEKEGGWHSKARETFIENNTWRNHQDIV